MSESRPLQAFLADPDTDRILKIGIRIHLNYNISFDLVKVPNKFLLIENKNSTMENRNFQVKNVFNNEHSFFAFNYSFWMLFWVDSDPDFVRIWV